MPFYERGPVRIHYEEKGSGFPLFIIPGGGLNSTIGVPPSVAPVAHQLASMMSAMSDSMRC